MALITNLKVYWKLDETTGSAVDATGNGYDLTNNSGAYAAALINNGIDLERGSSAYLSSATALGFSATDVNCSFSCWVKPESNPSSGEFYQIVSYSVEDTTGWQFFMDYRNSGGTYQLFFGRTGEITYNLAGPLSTSSFTHIVGTYDGTQVELFVNGVSVGTAAASGVADVGSSPNYFRLGQYRDGNGNVLSRYFDGIIDEVGFWQKDLTSDEITQLYNSGAGLAYGSFSFPDVTTSAVTDIDITTATGNGEVVEDGGQTITQRGVCWNTVGTPTIANSTATTSGTTGVFSVSMTGLTAGTLYYVRAFATNATGTSYGETVTFTTVSVANNQVIKDINGVVGETYAVQFYVGGTTGTVTVSLGTTGTSQIFNAGAGTSVLQGTYGGLSGLIFEASGTFDGYIDNVYYVLVLGSATIDWDLDTLTNVYPINSSVTFKRIENNDFNRFRIYRYLDVSFKDLNAYVTVVLKKEQNEDLSTSTKEFVVSNTSGETLPFLNKKISTLFKSQALRIGFSNNNLDETFAICQFIIKGTEQPPKNFDPSKIISMV